MIHLDTNYLIGLLINSSPVSKRAAEWLAAGEQLATSAIAWAEFLNGPVVEHEIALVEAIVECRIVQFDKKTAEVAGALFNATGRRRGSRFDCLIAATAILNQARMATSDAEDFAAFEPLGLKLA